MTELLDPRPGDRVLEVGTGSGYQAAILSAGQADLGPRPSADNRCQLCLLRSNLAGGILPVEPLAFRAGRK